MNLPAPLAALGRYRQFILYDVAPSTTKPGRTEKFPINQHRARVDAHDPAHWMDFATAHAAAARLGCGVGFTFTAHDPFFFVDVDGCLGADGQWSEAARSLCAWFTGAAVEVSHSGRGLHIIGTGQAPEPRAIKCGNVFDLFTSKRFCALTFQGLVGDASTVHTPALQWVVANYLQPRAGQGAEGSELTDSPVAEWRGPTDDEDLIRRALQSKSAGSVFGGRASFADLWHADEDALAKAYPADGGGPGYDSSKADQALLAHLAFWTGRHGTRMVELARRSKLAREKWERDDYLHGSAAKACAMQAQVLQDKLPEPVEQPMHAAPTPNGPIQRPVTGTTFLSPPQQAELFKGCVYVTDHHAVLVPGGEMLGPDRFRVRFGGYTFAMDVANERTSRNAWEAFTESQALRPPKADGICFRPMLEPGAIIHHTGRALVNVWWPFDVPRTQGDPSPFLQHLAKVLPSVHDQTVLLSYMAACVQHKGIKFQWAPFLQGVEGNGKTIFSQCVAEAVGRRYVHWPKASKLSKEFNAWMVRKLFYGVEDVYTPSGKADVFEELKVMITGGDGLEIEAKGVDQTSADVCGNFILNSNHPDGVRKTRNDRRIAPLFCAQQSLADLRRDGMDGLYVSNLYDWLKLHGGYAIVSELLHTYRIPAGYNPALDCPRAPVTTSTETAIAAGLGAIEQDVQEAIDQQRPGFRGGWVSSMALGRLLDELRGRRMPRNKRREMLVALGFDYHPGLERGQVHNIVLPDGGRPTLFVHVSNPARNLTNPAEIARAYTMAQE